VRNDALTFPDLLRLIDDRSVAFRSAVASAPDLDAQVPSCPEWSLHDLAQHIGEGRRAWAATVAAGPSATRRADPVGPAVAPRERGELVDWLGESTALLLDALQEAGPDRGCWTWWGDSQSPQTAGAVARHQLQQMAVHTYDAQLAVGAPQPLPEAVALDGVDEFLSTCCATRSPWPHEPAVVDYHASEGRSWRLRLSADGARVAADPTPSEGAPDFSARATAHGLVMALYGRNGLESLEIQGDARVFDQLAAWEPE
jgi:uncharacterized protein (TIGR03083 family)